MLTNVHFPEQWSLAKKSSECILTNIDTQS